MGLDSPVLHRLAVTVSGPQDDTHSAVWKLAVLPLKKIENPRLGNNKPKKTQGQISIRFRKISGKNRTFPEKKQIFPEKKSFYPSKFSDDFFLVIASDFQIYYPDFSNFDHFSTKMSYFLQKTTKKVF